MDFVAFALTTLLAAGPEAGSEAPGFRQVLQEIHEHSKILEQARAGVAIADGEVKKAWTAWQPNVSAIGSLTFNSVQAEFDSTALTQGVVSAVVDIINTQFPAAMLMAPTLPPGEPLVLQPHVQIAGILQASQTLFNITALRAPFVAKAARRAALAQVDAAEDELLFQGATVYATLVGLRGLDIASVRAAKVAEQRIAEARVRVEAGTATQLVVTRAETDKITAESQRIAVQGQLKKLAAGLAVLMGRAQPVQVTAEPLSPVLAPKSDALARSSVRAKRLQQEAAESAIGLSNMAWLPTLQADGQLRYANVEGFSGDRFLATATINLVIPLYDKGLRYADTDIAEARAAAAARGVEQEELAVRAFLEEARADLEAAQAELTQAEAQLKLANESVTQAEELVKNGLATALDLTDADSRRFGADQNAVQKKLALDLALLRLHYASGGRLLELLEQP